MQQLADIQQQEAIRQLLGEARSIAIVGLSPKEQRPSNMVGRYLLAAGYRIFPVNPGQESIFDLPCFADLASLPEPVDIVDIFRRSEDIPQIVEQVLAMAPLPRAIWMQQGIVHHGAAELARQQGLLVVMDRCLKVDHQNLSAR